MKFLYKLFGQNHDSREGIITVTSGLNIVENLLIAIAKIIIGALSSSIAIISEGVNNATDALTSVIAFVGSKLAKKHPDEKHPFGYGRIEYLTSLVIAIIILVTGVEMLTSSVELIFNPAELSVSYISITIVAVSFVIKLITGIYTIKMGRKASSSALVAVGVEGRNDSFASIITILSSVAFLVFGLYLDAYAGIIISALIIKAGIDTLKETVSDILGRTGDHELAVKLYREIRKTDGIIAAADMILHNYGPEAWTGSVNVEIDHNKSVGEIYQFLHELQLRIMHEYKVTMVFGVYAVDNDHEGIKKLRRYIGDFVKSRENIKSFHALYFDSVNEKVYVDFIVRYSLKDWDGLKSEFNRYMKEIYPDYEIELTVETEFI